MCAPLTEKWYKGRKLIMHSDSAKAYRERMAKCLHDSVVQKSQRMKVQGKWTWLKPIYTKVVSHKLPVSRKVLKVQAGTQYIDGFCRILKTYIQP